MRHRFFQASGPTSHGQVGLLLFLVDADEKASNNDTAHQQGRHGGALLEHEEGEKLECGAGTGWVRNRGERVSEALALARLRSVREACVLCLQGRTTLKMVVKERPTL